VLAAAVRWTSIEDNAAALVRNPAPRVGEIDPFDSWEEIDAIVAELDAVHGVLVEFLVGTGVRPERRSARTGRRSSCGAGSSPCSGRSRRGA